MNDIAAPTVSTLVDELHRKLGRNLLRFQTLEFQLKHLLPYIHPDGGAKGADGLHSVRTAVSRKTLGELIKDFRNSIATPTPELLEPKLQDFLDARNELVHHFFRITGVDLATVEGVRAAIAHLDRRYQEAEWLYGLVKDMSAACLLAILETPGFQTAEFAEYRHRLARELGPDTEIISHDDPARTHWPTTRIVALLRLAERETDPIDGMTSLARAGAFIRQREPDVGPKTYGLRKLMDVLTVSDLFDVDLRENATGHGVNVLYRSK